MVVHKKELDSLDPLKELGEKRGEKKDGVIIEREENENDQVISELLREEEQLRRKEKQKKVMKRKKEHLEEMKNRKMEIEGDSKKIRKRKNTEDSNVGKTTELSKDNLRLLNKEELLDTEVKGLNYEWLAKIRSNIDKEKKMREELVLQSRSIMNLNKILVNDKGVLYIQKQFFEMEHPHHKDFHRRIQDIITNIMNNKKFEKFNSRLHSFKYKCNIHMGIDKTDIPLKCIYYNEQEVVRKITYYLNDLFLNEIEDCFKWHMQNKKKSRNERLRKRPLSKFLKKEYESDESIDIFKMEDNDND